MATKVEMMGKYATQLKELGVEADETLLTWITDRVGPANYDKDGQLVAATQPAELARVYTGFVGDELAETDEEKGMSAINEVMEEMKDIKQKYRATVYYLLAKKYGK